jgi:transcriptional regulator with XRE-family HTH domain
VPGAERRLDRAARLGRQLLVDIGREIHDARLAHGLNQAVVGQMVGTSGSTISRIERGLVARVEFVLLARLCAAVGLSLQARVFPAGQPVRDVAHLALLEQFRALLHRSLRWLAEVPLPIAGDRRAWDAVAAGVVTIGIEAETHIRDVQAAERRLLLKKRDGGVDRVVLLLANTRWHRHLLRAHPELWQTFPIPPATALARLTAGQDPGGDAIILL